MKVVTRFEGGAELARNLERLPQRVSRKVLREALREAAEPMRARMSTLAPHEPGKPDLRDAMVISTARGEDAQEAAVAVGPSLAGFYGSFQEEGTAFHAAQPFARPAFDETAPDALGILGQALWRELAGRGLSRSSAVAAPVSGGPGGSLT